MPWCANVPVFLDSPPPIHIDAHSRPQFSFCPFPLSRPCLCQNTKEILIFAFILTHITFFPGVCHKHKHYFQRQDKTIVSAIEISQVCYSTCSCRNKNWQTMCSSVSVWQGFSFIFVFIIVVMIHALLIFVTPLFYFVVSFLFLFSMVRIFFFSFDCILPSFLCFFGAR